MKEEEEEEEEEEGWSPRVRARRPHNLEHAAARNDRTCHTYPQIGGVARS